MDHEQLWQKTSAVFRTEISEDVCDLWLGQLAVVALEDDTLYLTGPDRARSWIELRYGRVLMECASKAAGREIAVALIDADSVPLPGEMLGSPAEAPGRPDFTPLNPRYTFDQFVIGASNHVAHAASLAVAEQPAQAFNPLFIYGAPGVGKTHLLQSTGNYLRREAPELRVTYMTAENFAGTFRSVLRDGTISDFKQQLRDTDVLLIDDIQFLQNKTKTEEEFFHTFNAMHEAGRQLVISCDRRPRELNALADRLLARFESGLVVEIEEPDAHLRTAILRKRAQLDNIPIDCDKALSRIAERSPANVRSLEGALIRVSAFASMRRSPLTADLVDELLDALHPRTNARRVSVADVQRAVSRHFELSLDDMLSSSRDRRVSDPRQLAMFLACELTGDSLPMIAAAFKRNHSTVVHARDKLAQACLADADLAATADSLRRVINSDSENGAVA